MNKNKNGEGFVSGSEKSEFAPMAIAILIICFLVGMTGKFAFENFPNLVSPLSGEFGFARATVNSIYSMGGIITGLSGPIVGTLFDRLGPRNVYGLGILAGGIGLVLASFAGHILHFYFSISLLIGFTAAACGNVTNSALASRWFRRKLPLALAIIYSSMGAGSFLGLSLSQILIEHFGWRRAELTLGICVLAMIPLLMLMPWKRLAAGRKEPFAAPTADRPDPPEVEWTMGKAVRTTAFWGLASVFFFTGNAMFAVVIQAVTYLIEV
ncbi:MAG: MFS transporter, partial [Alphaproteobacteria bacterium]